MKEKLKNNSIFWQILSQFSKMFGLRGRIRGNNNQVSTSTSVFTRANIRIRGMNNTVTFGQKDHMKHSEINIVGDNNTVIIEDGVSLHNTIIHLIDDHNYVRIGEKTTIGGARIACMEGKQITIGKDCLFSTDISITNGDYHSIINPLGERLNPSKDIHIGNHVWIGYGVAINKGVIIKDKSIVGIQSVVTRAFSDENVAIAGNPARIIKENINWVREKI